MKIVIDIPKKAYETIKAEKEIDWLGVENILDCIKIGTPLSKGHGYLISRFRDYQIEWLTSHNDIDLQETEMWVVQFLKDTAECFLKTELPSVKTDGDLVKENTDLVKEDDENADKKGIFEETVSQSLVKDGDLISRQAVITMLQKIENAVEDGDGFQFNEWIEYAKDIPSAEKTAEWKLFDAYRLLYDCSNCGQESINKYRFCPWCGARMKEGDKE